VGSLNDVEQQAVVFRIFLKFVNEAANDDHQFFPGLGFVWCHVFKSPDEVVRWSTIRRGSAVRPTTVDCGCDP
jgi:hypothetical protein